MNKYYRSSKKCAAQKRDDLNLDLAALAVLYGMGGFSGGRSNEASTDNDLAMRSVDDDCWGGDDDGGFF